MMAVRFPAPLQLGNLVAITAPSAGVPSAFLAHLERAKQALVQRGFTVVEGECLRSQYKNKSDEKRLRARELMAFFTRPDISAVMPPWGGDLAIEILELLDFQLLAQVEPKWFSGYSDLSTLAFPLTTLAGWATLHGPNLMELGTQVVDQTTQGIWSVLESPRGTWVEQHASQYHQADPCCGCADPQTGFNLTQPTRWQRLDGNPASLQLRGRLIGGCLDTLARLAGTRFGNLPHFCEQHGEDGVILYLENVEMNPCELTRALYSLRLHGWFQMLSGILVGRHAAPDVSQPEHLSHLEALHSALGDLSVPVLFGLDIGHIPPQLSLVNGALAFVFFQDGSGRIVQAL